MEELDYKKLYEEQKHINSMLKEKIDSFSMPSRTKLFYALNRHQNDWADMLNSISVSKLDIDKAADKTVERLKIIYGLILANTPIVDLLKASAGITGDEDADMNNRKPFVETIAQARK